MKYYIIGPSCSGKTTLASALSIKTGIKHIQLDNIFFDFSESRKGKIKLSLEKIQVRIKEVLKTKSWIIEGIQQVPEIFDSADKVIYLKPKITVCLAYQWKRYLTNKNQRHRYGLVSNIKLTISIVKQFLGETKDFQFENVRYSRVSKSDIYSKKYSNKTVVLTNRKSYSAFTKSSN